MLNSDSLGGAGLPDQPPTHHTTSLLSLCQQIAQQYLTIGQESGAMIFFLVAVVALSLSSQVLCQSGCDNPTQKVDCGKMTSFTSITCMMKASKILRILWYQSSTM